MKSRNNIDYMFKHCRKGHYYQGEEFPYCKNQNQSFEDITYCNSMRYVKTCLNGHAYEKDNLRCPYSGVTKVCGSADMITAWICEFSMEFKSETIVQVDNYPIVRVSKLEVCYLQHTHRIGYTIVNLPGFDYRIAI